MSHDRERRQRIIKTARRTAESITYTSGEHHAPGYGAFVYQEQEGHGFAYIAVCGETWKPSRRDAWTLINKRRQTFASRESARKWCAEVAAAHGYPHQTDRPAYDLLSI